MQNKRALWEAGMIIGVLVILSPLVITLVALHEVRALRGNGVEVPATVSHLVNAVHVHHILYLPLSLGGAFLLTFSLAQLQKCR